MQGREACSSARMNCYNASMGNRVWVASTHVKVGLHGAGNTSAMGAEAEGLLGRSYHHQSCSKFSRRPWIKGIRWRHRRDS